MKSTFSVIYRHVGKDDILFSFSLNKTLHIMSHILLLFRTGAFQWMFNSSCQLYRVNMDPWRKLMMCVGGTCKLLDWLLFYQGR